MYSSEDDYGTDLDAVRIGDINLVALGRAYRIIRMHSGKTVRDLDGPEGETGDSALNSLFLQWLFDEGPTRMEKEIALRMLFDEMFDARRIECTITESQREIHSLNEDEVGFG